MNLLERIDHWVRVAPTATAHISGDRKLTFGQLGAYSNALAAHLLERYGDDRAPVAVLGHREPIRLQPIAHLALPLIIRLSRPDYLVPVYIDCARDETHL